MQIIAHRGASREYPENTLKAFARALEIGVDAFETDILMTTDRKLVLRHDDLLLRQGCWTDLRKLTYAGFRSLLGPEGSVLLAEFLELYRGKIPLMLDLKMPGTAAAAAALVQELRIDPAQIHMTSFLIQEVRDWKRLCPQAACSMALADCPEPWLDFFARESISEVSLHRSFAYEPHVRQLHAAGLKTRIYPVNWDEEAAVFSEWGVEGIFTDDPAVMQRFRK